LPWGSPAQLGLFADLCTWSPDLAPECCLQHDLSFGGGAPHEFMVANHELALCFYSYKVNPWLIEQYFERVSSPAAFKRFHVTEVPQRRLPVGYPHTCDAWRW
jgi:hypothetical protein